MFSFCLSSKALQVVALLLLLPTAVRLPVFANGLATPFARSPLTSLLLNDTYILLYLILLTG